MAEADEKLKALFREKPQRPAPEEAIIIAADATDAVKAAKKAERRFEARVDFTSNQIELIAKSALRAANMWNEFANKVRNRQTTKPKLHAVSEKQIDAESKE